MKNNYLLPALLFTLSFFAQKHQDGIEEIIRSERLSAQATMNVQVNPNTHNYDVTHHKLEFTVDPADYYISGKVTTTFTALENMTEVVFDLSDVLEVSQVRQGETNLAFTQNFQDELIIALPSALAEGNSATVEITYEGVPPFGQQAFSTAWHSGSPILYTLSEPFGAKDWWPCKQDLNDKIESVDIFLTVPSEYVSVSNGLEVSQTISGASTTTHFHHGHPIPAYLIAIAVTNYSVFTQTAGTAPNDFPIVNYVYPEDLSFAENSFAVTPAVMELFEEKFGTYPYADEKYGHAQFAWGGGMEHTTVSFMGGFSRSLIAHELGHHWFGNKVTCGSWKDIWINEGFATYMAAMVIEEFDGLEPFIAYKASLIGAICSQPDGAVYLTDSEALNSNRIFSARLSYYKGAMVVEMLRWKLGDEAFFSALNAFLNDPDHAFGYAVTTDLKEHLEATSGQNLDEFFDDWLYNQGFPSYEISVQNNAPGTAQITIHQTQSHASVDFFEMPVPVRLFGSGGQQLDIVLEHTLNGQVFETAVPFEVTDVAFDPERHILSQDNQASLGVASAGLLQGLSVYPNPATNRITVSVPDRLSLKRCVVSNTLGQTVVVSEQPSIDISYLADGLHFITVETQSGNRTFKFLKH